MNMKVTRIKILGIVILCASFATTASAALPEWRQGEKGIAKEIPFTAESTNGKVEGGPEPLTCKKGKSTGAKLKNAKETNEFTIKDTGCMFSSGCEVNSPGLKEGEVETKKIKGKLGYLEKSAKKVGILFKSTSGEEYTTLEGSCIGKTAVKGGVIGEGLPVNSEGTEAKLVFEKGVGSEQKWTQLEGETETHEFHAFSSVVWVKATETVKFGTEKVELAG
jgi:hypothetical protein